MQANRGNYAMKLRIILGVLVSLAAISSPAQTAREQIGLGASGSSAPSPSSTGFAQPPSNQAPPQKFCKVNGKVYQVDQLQHIQGVVEFKEKGVVIMRGYDGVNTTDARFALTNYQGEIIADRIISVLPGGLSLG